MRLQIGEGLLECFVHFEDHFSDEIITDLIVDLVKLRSPPILFIRSQKGQSYVCMFLDCELQS